MNKELIEKIITYNYNEYGAEFGDALVYLKQENEWLHHIIKEVREIFKDYGVKEDIVGYSNYTISGEMLYKLLEILNKVNIKWYI